jgi:chromosome segregation ATPase
MSKVTLSDVLEHECEQEDKRIAKLEHTVEAAGKMIDANVERIAELEMQLELRQAEREALTNAEDDAAWHAAPETMACVSQSEVTIAGLEARNDELESMLHATCSHLDAARSLKHAAQTRIAELEAHLETTLKDLDLMRDAFTASSQCTAAERKVLEAMAEIPEQLLRSWVDSSQVTRGLPQLAIAELDLRKEVKQ